MRGSDLAESPAEEPPAPEDARRPATVTTALAQPPSTESGAGWVVAGALFGVAMGVVFGLLPRGDAGSVVLYVGFGTLLGVASRWVALDASSRGMDGFAWAAGTMALAIVVFPAYLFQRSRTEVVEGTKVCPACAERVRNEASTCRYCGADVSGVVATPSATRQLEACPHCGKRNPAGLDRCQWCHKPYADA